MRSEILDILNLQLCYDQRNKHLRFNLKPNINTIYNIMMYQYVSAHLLVDKHSEDVKDATTKL